MIIGYHTSEKIKAYVNKFLEATGLEVHELSTLIGRNISRAIESELVTDFIFEKVNTLLENLKYYDEETFAKYSVKNRSGRAFFEVPRGVLTHYVNIENGRIENYDVIAPTTWNASPKDANGINGPYEEAIIGLHIANPDEPVEILRAVHSFDPCIACAVHTMDLKGNSFKTYRIGQ